MRKGRLSKPDLDEQPTTSGMKEEGEDIEEVVAKEENGMSQLSTKELVIKEMIARSLYMIRSSRDTRLVYIKQIKSEI